MTRLDAYLHNSDAARAVLGVLSRVHGRPSDVITAPVLIAFMAGRYKPSTVRGVMARLEAFGVLVKKRLKRRSRKNRPVAIWRVV
jgi:hypothetical protein